MTSAPSRLNRWFSWQGLGRVLRSPLDLVSSVIELALSARGLSVLFLMAIAFLSWSPWLRPPLSPDIRGTEVSWGIFQAASGGVEESSAGQHHFRFDSTGVVMMALAAVGAIIVLVRPRCTAFVAGILLCAAFCGNAVTALNHPTLVESMDLEIEQRAQMVDVLATSESNVMSDDRNGRIGGGPVETDQLGQLGRGWVYLLHGRWLVPLCALGILLASRGSLPRRLGFLFAWSLVGSACVGLLTSQRLQAEYHWLRAERLYREGSYRACRDAVAQAVAIFPEFADLQRTMLLVGQVDYLERRDTPEQRFFLAVQLAHYLNPSSTLRSVSVVLADTGEGPVVRRSMGLLLTDKPPPSSGTSAHAKAVDQTVALAAALQATGESVAIRRQVVRIFTLAGLEYYWDDRLTAARDAWRRADRLGMENQDVPLFLAKLQTRMDPAHPTAAVEQFNRTLAHLADRILRADILTCLADAHFEAGEMELARDRYAESLRLFNLPKDINYRAQNGLMGL